VIKNQTIKINAKIKKYKTFEQYLQFGN
jgi:hypothetical protein